jgi:hypothetical protein
MVASIVGVINGAVKKERISVAKGVQNVITLRLLIHQPRSAPCATEINSHRSKKRA